MLLEDVISQLMYIQTQSVKLYLFSDLENKLKKEMLATNINHDIYIVPFYYNSDRVYELYEYELEINNANEISMHIKNGCIQLKNSNPLYFNILTYIMMLYSSKDIKKQIKSLFDEYNIHNLYFEYYEI